MILLKYDQWKALWIKEMVPKRVPTCVTTAIKTNRSSNKCNILIVTFLITIQLFFI